MSDTLRHHQILNRASLQGVRRIVHGLQPTRCLDPEGVPHGLALRRSLNRLALLEGPLLERVEAAVDDRVEKGVAV